MGWINHRGDNHYWYEYRDDGSGGKKNTYIGKCNSNGEIYEAEPGFEDRVTIPPPEENSELMKEEAFHQALYQKFLQMKESQPEMVDIEHGEDYESLIIMNQESRYSLLMRPKDEKDYDIMRKSIASVEAMHELEEIDIEDKHYFIVDSGSSENRQEIVEALKESGNNYGEKYHQHRMNKYLWGDERDE